MADVKIRYFIKQHYEKAKQRGWLPYFAQAALKYDFPLALLLALASRETNMSNIKGDWRTSKYFPKAPGYHGYGIMQVDIGTDPAWIASGAWQRVDESIMHGTKILDSKRDELNRMWSGARTLHDFLWTLAASYNHGTKGSYADFKAIGNPDKGTTGHDYGRDVLGRMVEFQLMLNQDGVTATSYAIKAVAALPAPNQQPPSVTDHSADNSGTGAGLVIQTGDDNTIESNGKPQAVAGGGVNDPVQTLPTTEQKPEKWYSKLWAAIAAFLATVGLGLNEIYAGAKTAFSDNPTALIISVLVIVAVVAIFWKIQDNKHQSEENEKQRAHERDMANLKALQDPKQINAVAVPPAQLAAFTQQVEASGMTTVPATTTGE